MRKFDMVANIDRSPLTDRPLNLPGQSIDYALREFVDGHFILPGIGLFALWIATIWEWFAYERHIARQPWLFSIVTALTFIAAVVYWRLRWKRVIALRLGRDGERAVGQFLETHVEPDATVFHDVPGTKGNIDHVVICSRGIYAIETKTRTKPGQGKPPVVKVEAEQLTVNGFAPDRNPMSQARACADDLKRVLAASTGKIFHVQAVVVFPGWFIEDTRLSRSLLWVLEPKALPAWIKREKVVIGPTDVHLATYHLSRYIRTHQRNH